MTTKKSRGVCIASGKWNFRLRPQTWEHNNILQERPSWIGLEPISLSQSRALIGLTKVLPTINDKDCWSHLKSPITIKIILI